LTLNTPSLIDNDDERFVMPEESPETAPTVIAEAVITEPVITEPVIEEPVIEEPVIEEASPQVAEGPNENIFEPIQEIQKKFCLVTHHTQNNYNYASIAIQSQQRYAERHGYGHVAFFGRISGDLFVDPSRGDLSNLWGGGLYWQKLAAVQQVLQDGIRHDEATRARCQWVMWLDSDAVITNETVSLSKLVAKYASRSASRAGEDADIILSKEDDHPINAGVFFVRNTAAGRGFIDALLALYPLYKDNNLPEQAAMGTLAYTAEPWPSIRAVQGVGAYVHPKVAIAEQRAFNSFQGVGRTFSIHGQWQPCDFVAHFAGTPWHLREQGMMDVLQTIDACQD
jgi:hypothetical protein